MYKTDKQFYGFEARYLAIFIIQLFCLFLFFKFVLKRVRVDHLSNAVATTFACTFGEALIAKLVHFTS